MTDCATPLAPLDTNTRAFLFFLLFSPTHSLVLAGPNTQPCILDIAAPLSKYGKPSY